MRRCRRARPHRPISARPYPCQGCATAGRRSKTLASTRLRRRRGRGRAESPRIRADRAESSRSDRRAARESRGSGRPRALGQAYPAGDPVRPGPAGLLGRVSAILPGAFGGAARSHCRRRRPACVGRRGQRHALRSFWKPKRASDIQAMPSPSLKRRDGRPVFSWSCRHADEARLLRRWRAGAATATIALEGRVRSGGAIRS